jgi:hypothetical protein
MSEDPFAECTHLVYTVYVKFCLFWSKHEGMCVIFKIHCYSSLSFPFLQVARVKGG